MKKTWIDKLIGWYSKNWHLAIILILLVALADCAFNRAWGQGGQDRISKVVTLLSEHRGESVEQVARVTEWFRKGWVSFRLGVGKDGELRVKIVRRGTGRNSGPTLIKPRMRETGGST